MPYMRKRERLGDVLLGRNIITQEQLQTALAAQKEKGLMLGEMLVELGYVTQDRLNNVLCEHLHIEFVNLRAADIDDSVVDMLDEAIMRKYTLVPYAYADGSINTVKVAMADPMNIFAIDDVNMVMGMQVETYLADSSDIHAFLDKEFGKQQAQNIVEMYKKEQSALEEEVEEEKARKEEIENAPIVQLVNSIIEQAVRQRASDIHIEPFENIVRIRYRVDGSLIESITYDKTLFQAIIARLKIM